MKSLASKLLLLLLFRAAT